MTANARCHLVEKAMEQAFQFFVNQLDVDRPGWGQSRTEPLDPWSTAQILFSLIHRETTPQDAIDAALEWLRDQQNADGSWGSTAYGPRGDTPATASSTIALLEYYGTTSLKAKKGLGWLCEYFSSGWTTSPSQEHQRFQQLHHYSTAYAVRALARGSRDNLPALCIQEAVTVLLRSRVPGAGWGFQPDGLPDPAFTSYVVHALQDVSIIWGLRLPNDATAEALSWLASEQNRNGSWREWHGIDDSPEAAGYAAYVLLRAGSEPDAPRVVAAIDFLLQNQASDGGWPLDANGTDGSNNWVTHSVLLGLGAYSYVTTNRDASSPIPTNGPGLRLHRNYRAVDQPAATAAMKADEAPQPEHRTYAVPTTTTTVLDPYASRTVEGWTDLPECRPLDHTMYDALDEYVDSKIPAAEIKEVIGGGGRVEVHGILPEDLPRVAPQLGLGNLRELAFQSTSTGKRFNYMRPTFYRGTTAVGDEVIVVCVIPGRDYVFHYAMMVRHNVLLLTRHAEELISIYRYPVAERSLPSRTGLDSSLVSLGDRVLLGYVESIKQHLDTAAWASPEHALDTAYYGSYRYALPDGSLLNLLGVKYCFWGSIGEVLAHELCRLGVRELLYVGKLGALTSPEDVYRKVFCPSQFVVLHHGQVAHVVVAPPNRLLSTHPELNSGCHVSVPTVLEEDYAQRHISTKLTAKSIDNEISQIANAVSVFNLLEGTDVPFTALHFATDYIRRPNERNLEVHFDLSTNRSQAAREAREAILSRIWDDYLGNYLASDSGAAT